MDIESSSDPNEKVVTIVNLRSTTTYDNGTGTLRVSGLDYISEYEQVMRTLTYVNLADESDLTTRQIELTLHDGHLPSDPLLITVFMEPLNDSPFFNPSATPVRPEIDEDVTPEANTGVATAELAMLISDDDADASLGVVVVGVDAWNGVWQYTIDGGSSWNVLQANVSREYGLALAGGESNAIRFLPWQDYNGVASFAIVAWDMTGVAVSGSYIDARSDSSTDPFSSGSKVIPVVVNPVNDAPVLMDIPLQLTTLQEDDRNSSGDSVLSLLRHTMDVDLPEQLGIAVIGAEQGYGSSLTTGATRGRILET